MLNEKKCNKQASYRTIQPYALLRSLWSQSYFTLVVTSLLKIKQVFKLIQACGRTHWHLSRKEKLHSVE